MAIETVVTCGEQGFDLIRKIGQRIVEMTNYKANSNIFFSASFDRYLFNVETRVLFDGNITEYETLWSSNFNYLHELCTLKLFRYKTLRPMINSYWSEMRPEISGNVPELL